MKKMVNILTRVLSSAAFLMVMTMCMRRLHEPPVPSKLQNMLDSME